MSDGGGNGFALHLGSSGLPFLTKKDKGVPLYKNSDPTRIKPQQIRRARVDIFDLSDAEQLTRYNKIWEAVGYGLVQVADEEKHWVPEIKSWKVMIRWFIIGQMDPKELRTESLSVATDLNGRFEP